MSLPGDLVACLEAALLDAFPDDDALEQLMRRIGMRAHVPARAALVTRVGKLVEVVDAQGRVRDLLDAALSLAPGNVVLAQARSAILEHLGQAQTRPSRAAQSEARVTRTGRGHEGMLLESAEQLRRARDVIANAFLPADLEMLVMDHLGVPLANLVSPGTHLQRVFELVRACQARGWLERLLDGVAEERRQNPEVALLMQRMGRPTAVAAAVRVGGGAGRGGGDSGLGAAGGAAGGSGAADDRSSGGHIGPWYFETPLDFARPEVAEANRLLANAYANRNAARMLAESVGVSLLHVNLDQAPIYLMRDILRQAAAEQRVEQLLRYARSDPTIAAYHAQLVVLMASAGPASGSIALARQVDSPTPAYPNAEPRVLSEHLSTAQARNERQDRPRFVLVAGSGGRQLPETVAAASESLGRALAEAGFGLVTCGWDGVDAVVADTFARTRQDRGARVSSHVLQIVVRGAEPAFAGGNVVNVASEEGAWDQSIDLADAVVLIGGLGGTYETGRRARNMSKPVLPLAGSAEGALHADARRFHAEMRERWEIEPVPGLTRDDFIELASPFPGVIPEVVRCLRKIVGENPSEDVTAGARPGT